MIIIEEQLYYVYELNFGDRRYIGCTNNITRRKDQHNDNARKEKSKLGRFLKDSGIILKVDDFNIIFTSNDRSEALAFERDMAKNAERNGFIILNDNYSESCSRKGKWIGHAAKDYIVIDYVGHTATYVHDLRQYCLQSGLDYKLLQRTAKNHSTYNDQYTSFYADEWEAEPCKQKYINGDFAEEKRQNARHSHAQKVSKCYEVKFPDGHSEIVKNLDRFARDHSLTPGTLHGTLIFHKPTKGYEVIRRI